MSCHSNAVSSPPANYRGIVINFSSGGQAFINTTVYNSSGEICCSVSSSRGHEYCVYIVYIVFHRCDVEVMATPQSSRQSSYSSISGKM